MELHGRVVTSSKPSMPAAARIMVPEVIMGNQGAGLMYCIRKVLCGRGSVGAPRRSGFSYGTNPGIPHPSGVALGKLL